jgi:hypothetical protein
MTHIHHTSHIIQTLNVTNHFPDIIIYAFALQCLCNHVVPCHAVIGFPVGPPCLLGTWVIKEFFFKLRPPHVVCLLLTPSMQAGLPPTPNGPFCPCIIWPRYSSPPMPVSSVLDLKEKETLVSGSTPVASGVAAALFCSFVICGRSTSG